MAEAIVFSMIWIGQASFVLQIGDTRILMDPLPAEMGYHSAPVEVDVLTVSHEHADHNLVELAKGDPAILRGLWKGGEDWNRIDFQNEDVRIRTFPTYHDDEEGAGRGRNAMFLIEAEGLRLLHTGDLGHPLSEEMIEEIGRVDVLIVCVGGYYTIDAAEAKALVAQMKPRVVVPMHYKTDRVKRLPIEGVEPFVEGFENVRRPEKARLETTPGLEGFPEDETTVVVLPWRKPDDPLDESEAPDFEAPRRD